MAIDFWLPAFDLDDARNKMEQHVARHNNIISTGEIRGPLNYGS